MTNLVLDPSGFEEELKDSDKKVYDFKEVRFIEDDITTDILVKATVSGDGLTDTGATMDIVVTGEDGEYHKVVANIMQNSEGVNYAAHYNGIYYRINYIETKIEIDDDEEVKIYLPNNSNIGDPYLVLKDPTVDIECALLTSENFIRTLNFDKISSTQCDEFKANSGAAGAGGFGNYAIPSIAKDLECRYPDDGDLEDEQYATYQDNLKELGAEPIDFTYFKSGWYYNYQRMMKWVKNASEQEFLTNVSRHFNKTYLMDYYLTIMLLGGVDSLGKNLMVATWGPENHLYVTVADALNSKSEIYDQYAFEYTINGETVYLTPTKVKTTGEYVYATNEDGLLLYYKEEYYNRATQLFENNHTKFDADCVTTVPGDDIFYPIFYDIDTINGLDNSGQLLFDVDIEIGDQLDDGTAIFNTDDSHLWRRVRDYLGKNGDLAERWSTLRSYGYFTKENMIDKFYYDRQIAKIPEKYYNDDCFLKYIWEGPNAQKGSGTYLYCIHGSRYEHIKRWYSQRMYYIDTMFGIMGGSNSSLRFNHGSYDANFGHTTDYYASYPALAAANPDKYAYDQANNLLLDASSGREIIPIDFNVKTYQPAYVGVKWANTGSILYYRVGRNDTVTMRGNVPSGGDSEVFIFGDVNVKELGDLSPYNVKQVDFKNLTKLSKLILGSSEYSTVINKLDLGTNTYLADLQLTNCTSLTTVDVSGCSNLRTIDMTGSGITTVTLPIGGSLESIAYSDVITSINLQDFINLNTVTTPSLTNLTQLTIKNCPKILGTKEVPNAKGWALLQQTRLATNLTNIEMTAYGKVDPVQTSTGEFFFADKYYNYATSSKIRGDVQYTGTSIPTNYARFETAYPKLNITYTNISDASEMFADYKNLLCIQKVSAYIGDNAYGEAQYKDIYYWVDDTDELKAKWQTETAYSQYGASTVYEHDSQYYIKAGIYYRTLDICDDNDRNRLRSEIKNNLENFNGIKFTSVRGMFKNITVLDYLDPDTFNGIDLSSADTSEMFYGCTKLRYITLPGDITNNVPVYIYYNKDGNEVTYEEWDPSTGGYSEQKTNTAGKPLYREIFSGNETIELQSIYPKGIRNIGSNMFYECRRARILIKKLSNSDKLNIHPTAFAYICYDPSLESQDKSVTCERPVIMFEYSDTDLLKLTTDSEIIRGEEVITLTAAGVKNSSNEDLFFSISANNERELNLENQYINFNSSSSYLREVYFNIDEIVMNDSDYTEKFTISYAKRKDGKIILFDAIALDVDNKYFNKNSDTSTKNNMNIFSITQGALEKIIYTVNNFEIPLANYDCLDVTIPRQLYEKSVISYFTSVNYTDMLDATVSKLDLPITDLYIVSTEVIPEYSIAYMKNLQYVGFDDSVKKILAYAFYNSSSLLKFGYMRNVFEDSVVMTQKYLKVEYIGDSAFEGTKLTGALNLPDSLKDTGISVFKNCSNITSVVFAKEMRRIPEGIFTGCTGITSVSNINSELEAIESNAFNNCLELDLFPIRETIGNVGTCSLTPNSEYNLEYFTKLKTIGDSAFYKCNKISSGLPGKDDTYITKRTIVIPDSLEYIGSNAFYQDLGAVSEINVEIIWNGTDFSNLNIGANAFANIRTSWRPDGYDEPVEDAIYLPRVASIGSNAFKSRGSTKFVFAVAQQPEEEIGRLWVSVANKVIFSYIGMAAVTINTGTSQEYIATYLFSDNGTAKYAFLYNIDRGLSLFDVPISIMHNSSEYYLKEILSGSLDRSNGSLSMLIFKENSMLDTIESNVLMSSTLTAIITEDSEGNETENMIPKGLKISTGNVIKGTTWFDTLETEGFVVLGGYVIGYKPSKDENGNNVDVTSLDMSIDGVSECTTIYDNAFDSMRNVQTLVLPPKCTDINTKAFAGCEGVTSVVLPETLKTIGDEAFINCSIEEIVLPKSVVNVGSSIFGKSSGLGSLRSFIIEDGSTIKSTPFAISKEIKTGSNPADANITLRRLHIPSTSEDPVPSSTLRQLSQVTKLTVGSLKKNEKDGSYLIDSYPIYADTEGNKFITNPNGTYTQAVDASGNLLYCPAFYYDMVKETYPDIFLESTESKAPYPLPTYERDLDIGYIMKYPEASAAEGVDISSIESTISDLTREDIMRIISGFSKTGEIRTLSIRSTDYKKLTQIDKRIIANYRVTLKQYTNK